MLTYLIDDDVIGLYLAEQVLRLEDFATDIHLFPTAEAALCSFVAHLPTQVPQVIFLDLNMPLMDGWGFLQALESYLPMLQPQCRIYILTSSLILADTVPSQLQPHPQIDHRLEKMWLSAGRSVQRGQHLSYSPAQRPSTQRKPAPHSFWPGSSASTSRTRNA
jgi:CheY-like chemotaxis protein